MAVEKGQSFPKLGSLGDLGGRLGKKRTVVFFYPAAFTGGCTREVGEFQKVYSKFQEAGIDVVGVSTDAQEKNNEFCSAESLDYPLMSDEGGTVARALGIIKENGMANRTTYVVDDEGVIEHIYENVSVDGHAEAVFKATQA